MTRLQPGSRRARKAGCTCPPSQSIDASGPTFGVWWIVPGCKLHDPEYKLDPDNEETEQNA